MKPSQEPELEEGASDELDAGWGEPEKPSAASAAVPPVRSVLATAPAPADDIDSGWDDDDDDDEGDDADEPGVAPAMSAPDHRKPAPRVISAVTLRTLSKKERRALERKNRSQAAKVSTERKQSRRASRREEARRLAEQRLEERRQALAAAKKQKKLEQRRAEQRRAELAAEPERAEPKAGTDRRGGKASKRKGRLQKQTGGGWIVALIALITLGTAIFAWSRR